MIRFATLFLCTAFAAHAQKFVTLPSQSPLVTLKFVFLTGSASDPVGQYGVAALTAAMLSDGGTSKMTYQQIIDAQFPMATSISSRVDKEMTSFYATTHVDNLDKFYALFRAILLEPGWRAEDFTRLRDNSVNNLRVSLRENNEEELGKEVLYNAIYTGHPYGHHNLGKVSDIEKLKIENLKAFFRANYTRANLIVGLAGGYPASFLETVKADLAKLPAGVKKTVTRPAPKPIVGLQAELIDKQTRSVAVSFGFPISVKRGHPDYVALMVAQSWFGQHRMSGGRLYERIRESRGLNYGDYAYIEYFPGGMFGFEPPQNIARPQQIFQVWLRPLELPTAHFGIRLAMFEMNRLLKVGLSQEEFDRTKLFLSTYVNLLTKTKQAELGYAIDSQYYGITDFNNYVKQGLAKLTRAEVNAAVKRHLQTANMKMAIITPDAEEFRKRLLASEPSPMTYNSPKPQEILDEDKIVEKWNMNLKPLNVKVTPVGKVFE
jgi:zinc protease